MFFFDFSNVFPLFLWLVPMTPSDGPGGNRYPPSPNCNTVHNPAKPPSRNTLSPRGERDLRTTVQLCPPDPLFSLRSHKATSQPAGLPFVIFVFFVSQVLCYEEKSDLLKTGYKIHIKKMDA